MLAAGLPNVNLYIGRTEYYTKNPPNTMLGGIVPNKTFYETDWADDSLAYHSLNLQYGNPIYGNSNTVQPPALQLVNQLKI